jgi:hypothetical protein
LGTYGSGEKFEKIISQFKKEKNYNKNKEL